MPRPRRVTPGGRLVHNAARMPGAASTAGGWERVYAVVRRIPRGRVATYGEVASKAGFPHAPRLAGYALYALTEGTPLPWHRVVGAGGRLTLARLSPDGALTQRMRLEREGVKFDARGRAAMKSQKNRRRQERFLLTASRAHLSQSRGSF